MNALAKLPRLFIDSDVDEACFALLSSSDCCDWTTEGAALEWRDHRRKGCDTWLDCPVLGERCMLLSPEVLFVEDMVTTQRRKVL